MHLQMQVICNFWIFFFFWWESRDPGSPPPLRKYTTVYHGKVFKQSLFLRVNGYRWNNTSKRPSPKRVFSCTGSTSITQSKTSATPRTHKCIHANIYSLLQVRFWFNRSAVIVHLSGRSCCRWIRRSLRQPCPGVFFFFVGWFVV